MRLTLCALLIAAPALAQSPTDARDVLVAAANRSAQDARVTSIRLDDTTLTRDVAKLLGGRVDTGVISLPKRVTPPTAHVWSVRMMPPKVRGDSAFVRVFESTTMNGRPFTQGSLFTLVKRDGRWIVSSAELTGMS